MVSFPAAVTTEDLIAVVERTGYTAALPPEPEASAEAADAPTGGGETAALRRRLLVSLLLAVPVIVLAMVPAWQFRNWQWLSLTLAAPVAVWGAWPFHRAALVNARHGAATMDTLISVGVTASFAWSLYALFVGAAGETGMRMPFTLLAGHAGAGASAIYLDAAPGVTVLILLGRSSRVCGSKSASSRSARRPPDVLPRDDWRGLRRACSAVRAVSPQPGGYLPVPEDR